MSIIKLKNEPSNGLNLVSLFAGCGGSSQGYKAAGYDIRLAVEWDEGAAKIYRNNFPETPVFQGDIADLSIDDAKELSGVSPGELDVLDGSPPCQGFSTAGERRFTDERNQLFREFVRILKGYMPRAFIMENVSGLRKGKMKLIFAEMTKALKDSGYRVSCRELNAWWYGVPQTRTRLFWVGIRDDLPFNPSHPKPVLRRPISVKQALNLEALVDTNHYNKDEDWSDVAHTLKAKHLPRVALIETHLWGKGVEAKEESFADGTYDEAQWSSLDKPVGTLVAYRPPLLARSWVHPYPENIDKLGWTLDRPAGTLTSIRPPSLKEGVNVRYVTIEEAKILQSFTEDFQIKKSEYKYIGNSVPPLMARAVGKHLAEILNDA